MIHYAYQPLAILDRIANGNVYKQFLKRGEEEKVDLLGIVGNSSHIIYVLSTVVIMICRRGIYAGKKK